jgi:predicted AlkP superfamily pyrophosphatase or phosphodiesterase
LAQCRAPQAPGHRVVTSAGLNRRVPRITFAVFACIFLTLAAAITTPQSPAAQTDETPRLLVISLDGFMPSNYTGNGAHAPTLNDLARHGAFAEGVVGVLPSVTYPSHTTLITGVPPAVHGVFNNLVLDPEGRSNSAWYYYGADIKTMTLPMAAKSRGLRTAAVGWPVMVGMDVDYLFPEYLRNEHEDNLKMLRVLSTPRTLIDAVEVARGKPITMPTADRDLTDIAAFILRTFDPHVMLVHLFDIDDAEHSFGPGSPQAIETIRKVDGYVKELIDAASAGGRADRLNVAIVSDHGFLPLTTVLQPNALFKQEGLQKVDAAGRVTDWQAYFQSSGGSGFVYVKDSAVESRVKAILERLAGDPANGVRRIWTKADLTARGADPRAAFGIDMANTFYTGGGTDVLLKPSTSRGGHGFDPERPELHASLILAGPMVQKRGSLGIVKMTQIGPTLASILDVTLSPVADRPLDGVVRERVR